MSLTIKMVLPDAPRVRALADGSVAVPGVELQVDASIRVVGQRFEKMLSGEFDAGEMCVLTYLRAREEGWPFVGLPVFVVRGLKHRHIVVRRDSNVRTPGDLAGKTVALTRYVTSPVWTRALIQREYGVPLDSVRWLAAEPELWPISIPEFHPERLLEERTTLLDLLSEGKLDAAIFPGNDGYNCFFGGGGLDRRLRPYPNLKTLIDDPQVVIDYYRRTHIYPIIHMVVVRESILGENPDLATRLVSAFQQAKDLADEYLDDEGKRRAAEEKMILGRDPYECELTGEDKATMSLLLDCALEQKLLRKKPEIESLFAVESFRSGA
ncbi:MAG: hypothetical protein M1274_04600 [Actinobacteria bacterium]|nr:hypothetical protein [Actinomycetota bacterium]